MGMIGGNGVVGLNLLFAAFGGCSFHGQKNPQIFHSFQLIRLSYVPWDCRHPKIRCTIWIEVTLLSLLNGETMDFTNTASPSLSGALPLSFIYRLSPLRY